MSEFKNYLKFFLDGQAYAVPVDNVDRVIRAVEITPLPEAPEDILGLINIQGRVVAVINIRKRFQLEEKALDPGDQFIIARTSKRTIAFVVDGTGEISVSNKQTVTAKEVYPGLNLVKGVVKLDDGLNLVIDLEKILSLEVEEELDDEIAKLQEEGFNDSQHI